MDPIETQIARLPDSPVRAHSGYDITPFETLTRGAPFPRPGGGSSHRGGPRIELQLDSGPAAASEARAALTVLDGRADPDVLDDVRLLLSEVVTNAVRHSRSPRGTKIGLAVSVAGEAVRAEVTDGGRGFDPTPRDAPETLAGGWGLHLVDRLAARWGVDHGQPARVWFEVDPAT